MSLRVRPLTRDQANEIITRLHRHHSRVVGHRFAIGVYDELGELHGAAIVARPRARELDQWAIAEVSRLVTDGTPNACSMLYGACARAAKAMGFDSIQTYILESEPGTSLRAAGWKLDHVTDGGSSDRPSRRRVDKSPTIPKHRYVYNFAA